MTDDTKDGKPAVLISEDSDKFEEVPVEERTLNDLIPEAGPVIQCESTTKKGSLVATKF